MFEEAIEQGYSEAEALMYYTFQRYDQRSVAEEYMEDGCVKVSEF